MKTLLYSIILIIYCIVTQCKNGPPNDNSRRKDDTINDKNPHKENSPPIPNDTHQVRIHKIKIKREVAEFLKNHSGIYITPEGQAIWNTDCTASSTVDTEYYALQINYTKRPMLKPFEGGVVYVPINDSTIRNDSIASTFVGASPNGCNGCGCTIIEDPTDPTNRVTKLDTFMVNGNIFMHLFNISLHPKAHVGNHLIENLVNIDYQISKDCYTKLNNLLQVHKFLIFNFKDPDHDSIHVLNPPMAFPKLRIYDGQCQ